MKSNKVCNLYKPTISRLLKEVTKVTAFLLKTTLFKIRHKKRLQSEFLQPYLRAEPNF